MALINEYAFSPDVFDASSYTADGIGDIRLQYLKEAVINDGLVRDLRDGEWSRLFASSDRSWLPRGRELLKKLAKQNRLHRVSKVLKYNLVDDTDWCQEAVETNTSLSPLT